MLIAGLRRLEGNSICLFRIVHLMTDRLTVTLSRFIIVDIYTSQKACYTHQTSPRTAKNMNNWYIEVSFNWLSPLKISVIAAFDNKTEFSDVFGLHPKAYPLSTTLTANYYNLFTGIPFETQNCVYRF